MKGIWIRSQDECVVVFTKTIEAWDDGRIVARFGKDFKVLGSFDTHEDAKRVIRKICRFIQSKSNETEVEVFNIPLANKFRGGNR